MNSTKHEADDQEEKKLECESDVCDTDAQRLVDPPIRNSCTLANISSNVMDNHEHFRMETAWAHAEAEYAQKKKNTPQSPLNVANSTHVSPSTPPRSGSIANEQIFLSDTDDPYLNTNMQRIRNVNSSGIGSTQLSSDKHSLLQRYRTFLQKHEPSLDIFERIMERFVFYRYFFNYDHNGIKIELYYAAWNIIRWINDVVLIGWGKGMGMTIGTRNDWLGKKTQDSNVNIPSFQDWALSKMHIFLPVIRATLTATTCVYPAFEAWSRRPICSRPSIYGTALPHDETRQGQEEWSFATTTDLSPRARRLQWEIRQSRAADLSYWVERIRFVSRFILLSISWWAKKKRDENLQLDSIHRNNEEIIPAIPPLLRRGGELDPCEKLLPLTTVDKAVVVAKYKGKRTGRRSVTTIPNSPSPSHKVSDRHLFVKYINGLLSSKNNILYFHFVGELLHIFRPLYWSRFESIDWKRRICPSNSRGHIAHHSSNSSFSIWKAWLLSLLMDIVSDELLDITTGCKYHQPPIENAQKSPLLSGPIGRRTPFSPVVSVAQTEREELTWRRSRRSMYLLRSPVYRAVTLPLVATVMRVISKVPSFGLAKWASEYILDMMSYWNEHRFMLE